MPDIIWEVKCPSLMIRSGPGIEHTAIGTLNKGNKITQISSKSVGGKLWIEHSRGWSCAQELPKRLKTRTLNTTSENAVVYMIPSNDIMPLIEEEVQPGMTVTTTTTNPTDVPTTEETGYKPDIVEIYEESEDAYFSRKEYTVIDNALSILGLPYQYLPEADCRIDGSNDVGSLGEEYADHIVKHIPLLLMTPGKASFMTGYSDAEKENILSSLVGGYNSDLSDILNRTGRYYTFEAETSRYYKFLNPMCRIAAKYLDIDDREFANMNWMKYTRTRLDKFADTGSVGAIPFYVDSDTSISESFGNSTTQSAMASTVNNISDMGRELNFLMGYSTTAMNIDIMQNADVASSVEALKSSVSSLMGKNKFIDNLANHLTTVAAGGRLIFPEIWSDSNFSKSYDINLKLVSPDNDNLSIFLNIIVPLMHMVAFVAPQTINNDPNSYVNPFLVRAAYKGMFSVDTGIITNMSVNKGAEGRWTPSGIPTVVEINFTIKDLYQVMSITDTTKLFGDNTINNTALMDYIGNCCGVNVFEPEIVRSIDMWASTSSNIFRPIGSLLDFGYGIWASVQDKITTSIMRLYRGKY